MLSAGEHFALEVRGDSMIEAGILDGDIALIRKSEAADTGDIVVALIDDEEATLKRFRRRGASIALEPANTAYEVRILPPIASASRANWLDCSGAISRPHPGFPVAARHRLSSAMRPPCGSLPSHFQSHDPKACCSQAGG